MFLIRISAHYFREFLQLFRRSNSGTVDLNCINKYGITTQVETVEHLGVVIEYRFSWNNHLERFSGRLSTASLVSLESLVLRLQLKKHVMLS